MALPRFHMAFTGDASQLKAATADAERAVESVTNEVDDATTKLAKHTNALERDAAASKKAAQAARELEAAEKAAREQVERATGVRPSAVPGSLPKPAPAPTPATVPGTVPQVPNRPAPAPGIPPEELEKRRAAYIPLLAAQRDYEKQLAVIRAEEQAGVLSSAESSAAADRLARSYDTQVEAIKRADPALQAQGRSYKLAAHEMRVFNYQLSDIFTSVAGGMPLQMILFQQGPQIIDIFGGIGNAGRAALSVMTPLRVAMGGTAAVAAVAAVAYNQYLTSQKEVETAASGLGRAVAGSSAEMEASAQAGASAAGISVSSARSMEAAFLRTGRIGHQNFEGLIGISKDFAATMGISADDAGAALAEMFSNPGKAAEKLSSELNLIDSSTARYVQRLAAQNRTAEAQAVLLDALPGRLADAGEATTALGRLWDGLATSVSNGMDRLGAGVDRLIAGPPEEELRSILEAQINREGGKTGNLLFQNDGSAERLANMREQLKVMTERAELDRRTEEMEAASAARRQVASAADAVARQSPANASLRRREQLSDTITGLQAGIDTGDLLGDRYTEAKAAIDAKTRALQTMIPEEQRAAQVAELDLQIQKERNAEVRAGLVAARTRIQLAGEEISTETASQRIAAARKAVVDQANADDIAARTARTRALDEMLDRQKLEVSLTGKTAQEQALLRQEYELTQQVKADAWARGRPADEEELRLIREKIAAMRALNNMQGPSSRGALINSPGADDRTGYLNQSAEIDRIKEEAAIRRAALRARSPAELADVARRRAALDVDPDENADRRAARINDAGLEAREQAEKSLTDARLERNRALEQSLASEQLEISLIGKTAGEAERLRLIFQLTAQVKEEAARNGTKVDEAELASIRQKAAEYGKLADIKARTEFRSDIQFEMDQLGRSDRDQGIASRLKGAGMDVDLGSQEAQLLRQIEVLKDMKKAWEDIRDTGRDAVDQLVDSAGNGFDDIEDVFTNISKDIVKQLTTLGVANPLKNAIYGDTLPTAESVGGIGGIFSALTGGKNPALQSAASGLGSSVGAMTVSAGTVMINGGIAGGNPLGGLLGGSSGSVGAGKAAGAVDLASTLVGANENRQGGQINSFLKAGGVDIDAASTAWCAGFVNSSLERVGIKGTGSLTANSFQGWGSQVDLSSIVRGDVLLQSRGGGMGQQGGHVGFATGQSRMGTSGLELEMLSGNSGNSVANTWVSAMGLQARRATEAAGALAGVTPATNAATQGLGALGSGLGQVGNALASAPAGGASSGGGGLLGWIADGISSFFGGGTGTGTNYFPPAPKAAGRSFSVGGWTGDEDESEPVGVVHGKEFVVRAPVVARPGVRAFLQALNDDKPGFRRGGFVQSGSVAPGPMTQFQVLNGHREDMGPPVIHNYASALDVQHERRTNEKGQRQDNFILSDKMADAQGQRGGAARNSLEKTYNLKQRMVGR
ncbi:uncharacterized protein (TIGR02594 family) [Rhizobium sp. PP-CC-2G-626]|nr:uncharacterized protein (TIGR02594 family) [Rhizobium sp. PP-CC-2G-626]